MKAGSHWTSSGFDLFEHPGARVLARPDAIPWVRSVMESGQGLHAAAARDKAAIRLEGRDSVFVIPSKLPRGGGTHSRRRWAVRHYVRGGRLIPALLGDRYVSSGRIRPYHEAMASDIARDRGIPTPRVVAAACYPAGFFYRGDLVTEFIEDASDLVEAFFDSRRKGAGGAGERLDALRAAGDLVRGMAAAGLRHRDLHARNILLEWQGAAPKPHLLDLDRCEINRQGAAISPDTMYKRLRRSLLKWEHKTGIRILAREWKALEQAVAG